MGDGNRDERPAVRRGWFYHPDRDNPQPRGAKAKLRANLDAIETLVRLEREGRTATAEEARKLAAYSGWGALSNLFEPGALYAREMRAGGQDRLVSAGQRAALEKWEPEYGPTWDALSRLLTKDDLDRARQSTLNAHYTSPGVCKALWAAAERLGFAGGAVFEPGMGTGLIQAACPEHLRQRVRFTGVELDGITARIARQLFPDDDVRQADIRDVATAGSYDLVLGNVPFHENAIRDPGLGRALNLHNYCLAKGLQALKPGGVLVAVTSRHTLDSQMEQREFLAQRGEFLGAIRLPHAAFRANAGTDVVTDVVVMRRPDGKKVGDVPAWRLAEELLSVSEQDLKAGRALKPIRRNEYFAAHPAMLIGRETLEKSSQYAEQDYRVECDLRELDARLAQAIAALPSNVLTAGRDVSPQARASVRAEDAEEGAYCLDDGGNVRYIEGGTPRLPAWVEDGGTGRLTPFEKVAAAKDYVALRDQYRNLLRLQADPRAVEESLDEGRAELNRLYDAHVGRWGPLNAHKPLLRFLADDAHYFGVLGLEDVAIAKTAEGVTYKASKANIFRERTVAPTAEPTRADTIEDALTLSLSWRAKVDVDYIATLVGQPAERVREGLLENGLTFLNPENGELETRERYLSGNVRVKRDVAQAFVDRGEEHYRRNVEALEPVLPAWMPLEKIEPKLGVKWIPPRVVEAFADRKVGLGTSVVYLEAIDKWHVTVKSGKSGVRNVSDYGTSKLRGDEILERLLNLKELKVYDHFDGPDGSTVKVFDPVGTAEAEEKARAIQDDFRTYVRNVDGGHREQIERNFNYALNAHHLAEYDGSFLKMPGLSKRFRRDPQQLRAVWRFLTEGHGLMAHQVGSGKTIVQVELAMESRRLGLHRKPMLVVDNATVMQFAQTFREAYPHAKVLVGSPEHFSPERRHRFLSRAASGDWDAVMMPHSSFDQIRSAPASVKRWYDEQIAELKSALFFAKGNDDRVTTKQLASAIDRTTKKRAQVLGALEQRQDQTICWEELGIDLLLVDEAHKFKKVPFVTKMGNVRGIDTGESQRALNLFLKVRDVQQKNQGHKGVILATGTPVTNTLAEAWTMMRLASPHLIKEFGVESFDQFAASFGEVVTQPELNEANGKWRLVSRFAKFKHGRSLVQCIRAGWDVYMPDAFERVERPGVPRLKGHAPTPVVVPLSEANRSINAWTMAVYDAYERTADKRPVSYVPILLIQVGQAAALDPRLVLPGVPAQGGLKVHAAVENIVKVYHEHAARKGTQLVFADRYRPMGLAKLEDLVKGDFSGFELEGEDEGERQAPENAGGFNLYRDLKQKLVEAGLKEGEVVILNEAVDNLKGDQAKAVFDRVNSGDIRVLIGSTAMMGTGVNVQQRLVALHEMDPPRFLTPADEEQRHGRILRHGNENPEVQIFQYGMERSADAGIYHRIETKARFIKQVLCGVGDLDQFEDPASQVTQSLAELKALLTGDARVLQHVTLKEGVRQLKLQREGFFRQLGNKRVLLHQNEQALEHLHAHELPRAERLCQVTKGPLAGFLAKLPQQGASFSVTHAGQEATVSGRRLKDVLGLLFEKTSGAARLDGHELAFQIDGLHFTLRNHLFDTQTFCYGLRDAGDARRPLHSANVQSPTGLLRSLDSLRERAAATQRELLNEAKEREHNCVALQSELIQGGWPGEPDYRDKLEQLSRLEAELLQAAGENHSEHTVDTQLTHNVENIFSKAELIVDNPRPARVTNVPGCNADKRSPHHNIGRNL